MMTNVLTALFAFSAVVVISFAVQLPQNLGSRDLVFRDVASQLRMQRCKYLGLSRQWQEGCAVHYPLLSPFCPLLRYAFFGEILFLRYLQLYV